MPRILGPFDPSIARYGARRGWGGGTELGGGGGEARKQLTKVDEIRKMTVKVLTKVGYV